ncbi:MAG: MerR family transcriptional regulator [Gammaproteobacteria bacterium]|nr:MerR family transcriptional regulator [Gammaproteobacteria bacterium]
MELEEDLYRIGTVAHLTEISVERLRAWERRYGLLPANRSGRTRFYNLEQVERLKKMKRLIDNGHPISSLVPLSDEQLNERLVVQRNLAIKPASAGLIGPNLLVLEHQQDHTSRIDVRARWANMDAFMSDQSAAETLDVIVVQLPVLLSQQVEAIGKFHPQSRIVAIYQFATAKHIAATQELGVPTLNWPTTWQEIEHACATTAGMPLRAARTAARRFTDEELIAIAASSEDQSKCPQHLVELISSLNAFAEYSLDQAEEAVESALYQRVHTDTTQARAQLELALEVLVEADQLLSTPN